MDEDPFTVFQVTIEVRENVMIEEITAKLYDLAEEDYRVFNSRL